jgi:sulfur-oxidizing protein SoxY
MSAEWLTRRRRLLRAAGAFGSLIAAGAGPLARAGVSDDGELAFAARTFPEAIAALGGVPEPSPLILLEGPQVAENGALVPITVISQLAGTREILIVVDVNPVPVAVRFSFPEGTEPYVATRIRLAQSGMVCAAARTDRGLYAAFRSIQVTVGGCA